MRSIKDDFPGGDGVAIIHTQFLRGRSWRQSGMPRAKPIDRLVWHFLRSCDCHKLVSIREVSREIWDDESDSRNSARSSLKRLKELGLARQEGNLWMAIMPGKISPIITHRMGKKIKEGGAELHIPPVQNSTPSPGAKQHPPPVQKDTPPLCNSAPQNGANLHPIEIRDGKETTTKRAREIDIEKIVRQVLKIGVDDALAKRPEIFAEPLQIPNDELDWHRFVALGVAIAVRATEARNAQADPPRATSIGGLIHTIAPQYRDDAERARTEIEGYLSAKRRAKVLEAKSAEAEEQAKASRAPSVPPWDEERDALTVDLGDWLADRFPKFSDGLRAALDSNSPDLEFMRVRALRLRDRFGEIWTNKGSKKKLFAEHVRAQYLQEVWLFVRDLKAVTA